MFRFRGRFVHLIYKNHICIECFRETFDKVLKNREYKLKVAWETADKDHEYPHTHVLLFIDKKVDKKNSRCFDVGDIHPHIKPISTSEHFIRTYKYLEKERCILDELDGDEYPTSGFSDIKRMIQTHNSWADVINDDTIAEQLSRVLNWAREVYCYRPIRNFSLGVRLRDWQLKVLDLLHNQCLRKVSWIYDAEGNQGKSVLCNWLMDNEGAFFCNGGKIADISLAYQNQEIAVFDLPREIEEFTPYRTIECLKDGRFFSSKYQSCVKRFSPVKVLVLCNFLPDRSKMSQDRWDIYELEDGQLDAI